MSKKPLTLKETVEKQKRHKVKTWGVIKLMIRHAGIKDDDLVGSIDIGPYCKKIVVFRDPLGVEIGDQSSGVAECELTELIGKDVEDRKAAANAKKVHEALGKKKVA